MPGRVRRSRPVRACYSRRARCRALARTRHPISGGSALARGTAPSSALALRAPGQVKKIEPSPGQCPAAAASRCWRKLLLRPAAVRRHGHAGHSSPACHNICWRWAPGRCTQSKNVASYKKGGWQQQIGMIKSRGCSAGCGNSNANTAWPACQEFKKAHHTRLCCLSEICGPRTHMPLPHVRDSAAHTRHSTAACQQFSNTYTCMRLPHVRDFCRQSMHEYVAAAYQKDMASHSPCKAGRQAGLVYMAL